MRWIPILLCHSHSHCLLYISQRRYTLLYLTEIFSVRFAFSSTRHRWLTSFVNKSSTRWTKRSRYELRMRMTRYLKRTTVNWLSYAASGLTTAKKIPLTIQQCEFCGRSATYCSMWLMSIYGSQQTVHCESNFFLLYCWQFSSQAAQFVSSSAMMWSGCRLRKIIWIE